MPWRTGFIVKVRTGIHNVLVRTVARRKGGRRAQGIFFKIRNQLTKRSRLFGFSICSMWTRVAIPEPNSRHATTCIYTRLWHSLSIHYSLLELCHHCHPPVCLSSSTTSTILLHCVLIRLGLLFPSGLHANPKVMQISFSFFLFIVEAMFYF